MASALPLPQMQQQPHEAARTSSLSLQELVYCTLVHFFVHPPGASSSSGQPFSRGRVKTQLARVLLSDLTDLERLAQPTLPQLYGSLAKRLGEVGAELVQQVHAVLQGLATPDDLHRLFDALEVLLISNTGPSTSEGVQLDSPLGLLIRRCRINFRLMPFEAVAALHARIGAALAALPPVTDMLQGQGAGAQGRGQSGVGSGGAGVDEGVDGGVNLLLMRLRSQHQVEAVLSQRLQRLQCQGAATKSGSGQGDGGGNSSKQLPLLPNQHQGTAEDASVRGAAGMGAEGMGAQATTSYDDAQEVAMGGQGWQGQGDGGVRGEVEREEREREEKEEVEREEREREREREEAEREERELEALLADVGVPGAIQLQLREALRDRDYTAAVQALYRYFDHAHVSDAVPPPSGPRGRYQQALLGLADLHAAFGHTSEALSSLQEALVIAQQSGDTSCLASCLASLQRVTAQAPVAGDVSSLPSCPLNLCCTPCNPSTPRAAPPSPFCCTPLCTPSALCYAPCNPSSRPITPLLHALSAQAGDASCLASCLASLQRVMAQAPGAGGLPGLGLGGSRQLNHHGAMHALLNSCLSRGQALQMPQLVAFARLGLVRCALQTRPATGQEGALEEEGAETAAGGLGGKAVQVQATQALRDLSLLHHAAALDAMSGVAVMRPPATATPTATPTAPTDLYGEPAVHVAPGSTAAAANCRAVQQAAASAHLLCSHAWCSAGAPALAHLHALLVLACYRDCSPCADVDMARALLLQIIRDKQGVEAACALSCAHCPTDSRPLLVAQASGDVHLALSQGQLREAEWGVHGMADLVSPAPHLDPDLRCQVLLHQCEVSLGAGRLAEAHDTALQLFSLATYTGLQAEALQSLLLLCRTHATAHNWGPGLMYALSCLLHASRLDTDAMVGEAAVEVLRIWWQLSPGSAFELRHMLQGLMPLLLTSASHTVRAQALTLGATLALKH